MLRIFLYTLSIVSVSTVAGQSLDSPENLSGTQLWVYNNFKSRIRANNPGDSQEVILKQLAYLLECTTNSPCGVVLPVTGLKLEGKRLNNNYVELKFSTFTETNNSGFVLERKFSNITSGFDSVAFIRSKGNSYLKTEYLYKDFNTYHQNSFYRIKQIDIDGRYQYSNIIKVKGYSGMRLIKPFPNPGRYGYIHIQATGFESIENVRIVVLDAKGGTVYDKVHNYQISGLYRLENLALARGIYHITMYNNVGMASANLVRL